MSDASHRIDADELLAQAAWLRALARSLVRDEHAADDVVQETFAAAVERPPREPGALRGWLAEVARHAAWKTMRGDRRRAARETAAPRRAGEPSAAECVARIETQRALLDAVQELDEPFRTVIVLRFYDGKAPREIAAELGVTPEVVWQRLSRATAMLRARLDRRYGKRETWALVLMSPLGAKSAAAWTTTATAATTLGTGVAIVGTKTVVAATAAVVLGAWLVWPRAEQPDVVPPKDTSTASAATLPVAKPATPPRARHDADPATTAVAAPAAVPHAKTRGRVVDAVSGEPLAGAKVKVVRKSPGGGFQWTLTTGADGTFSGEVAETARYSEKLDWSAVHAPLYVEASARGHLWFYEGPWSGPQGEDLGDVKLDPGVVVRGRVVRDDGRPVAGAHVYATSGPATAGTDDPLNRARFLGVADGEGRFELDEGLAPTKGGELFTLLAACREGVAFRTLAVPKDRDVVEEVVLTLHDAAAAAVRVLDSDSRPIGGATVTVLPRFGDMGVLRGEPSMYSIAGDDLLRERFIGHTGPDGVARFDALPVEGKSSAYDVAAAADGCVVGWARGRAVGSPANEEIEIQLQREQAFVTGARVVDSDGRPVEGASVSVRRGSGPAGSATTGADGQFVLARGKGEALGKYADVEVKKDGYATHGEAVWRWPDDGRKLPDIRLERPAAIDGIVTDQDGKAVAGARVSLWRPDVQSGQQLPGDGTTQADGRFAFPAATAKEWGLRVQPPTGRGRWTWPDEVLVQGGSRDVSVRLERLAEGRATVTVAVIDAESAAPIDAEAAMFLPARAETNSNGSDWMEAKVDHGKITVQRVWPGRFFLWVRVTDRPYQLVPIRVVDGDTDVRATCRVRRGATVSGSVRMPDGIGAGGVTVGFIADGDPSVPGGGYGGWQMPKWNWPQSVAADGTFRIEGLPPSAYRIEAEGCGCLGAATVDASESDATVMVELQRAAVVRFRGTAADGTLSIPLTVSLDGGPWTSLTMIGLAGDMAFARDYTLRPGRLRWRATFRRSYNPRDPFLSAAPQEGEAVLEAGKETDVVVTGAAAK